MEDFYDAGVIGRTIGIMEQPSKRPVRNREHVHLGKGCIQRTLNWRVGNAQI